MRRVSLVRATSLQWIYDNGEGEKREMLLELMYEVYLVLWCPDGAVLHVVSLSSTALGEQTC